MTTPYYPDRPNNYTAFKKKPSGDYIYACRKIPTNLINKYFMGGKCRYYYQYTNNAKPAEAKHYTKADIESGINAAKEQRTGYYKNADEQLYKALKSFPVTGLTVAVVGNPTPWYPCVMLANGAKRVIAIESGFHSCDDDRITYLEPDAAEDRIVDVVVCIGEVAHYGLGQFGEDLDPDGDLACVYHLCRRLMAPRGKLFLSVPCGADMLVWNTRRVYGKHRLKALCKGWTLVEAIGWNGVESKKLRTDASYMPLMIMTRAM